MNKNDKRFGKGSGTSWLLTALLLGSLAYLFWFYGNTEKEFQLKYSEFVSLVENSKIKSVFVDGQSLSGEFKEPVENKKAFRVDILPSDNLWTKLETAGIEITVNPQDGSSFALTSIAILLALIVAIGLFYLISFLRNMNSNGGAGKIFSVGKSKARFYPPSSIGVKFSDVAGVNEVKDDLKDVVQFLKNPERFERIGAKIPRGVLLSGDPGNGKTILAKAVAGEANCPFFSISGSDFVEVFVGVGASRVRDLFAQAKRHAPCILFIDEIDAVGRQRGVGVGGGNDEREQTLNQLLSEMDGFETEPGEVIILAATNRVDVLDKALLRAGRFDRIVYVPYPDLSAREKILKIHSRNVKLSPSIDLAKIAKITPNFSGADLANLINEAALLASKLGKTEVDFDDIENSRDKIYMGSKNKSMIVTEDELKKTAYHEAGHALVRVLSQRGNPLHKVTIVSRGGALGVTWSMKEGDTDLTKFEDFKAEVMSALGSMAAEKIIFGYHCAGVLSDLEKANELVRRMVCRFGMSKLGPLAFDAVNDQYRRDIPKYSEKTLEKIDSEVERIISECYNQAEDMLRENVDKLHLLAKKLLEKETLDAKEVYELLGMELPANHSLSNVETALKSAAAEKNDD